MNLKRLQRVIVTRTKDSKHQSRIGLSQGKGRRWHLAFQKYIRFMGGGDIGNKLVNKGSILRFVTRA